VFTLDVESAASVAWALERGEMTGRALVGAERARGGDARAYP